MKHTLILNVYALFQRMNDTQTGLNSRSERASTVSLHQSHVIFHTCLNLVPGDVTWCGIIIHIKAGRVWKGPAFFTVGGGTSPVPLS